MNIPRCPGQDQRYWKPGDIFELICPGCGTSIEFWKDDALLACPHCQAMVRNPKIENGCAQWCQSAKECLGIIVSNLSPTDIPSDSESTAK